MRRVAAFILALSMVPCVVAAQAPTDSMAQAFEVDFAVPDAPALELLEVGGSSILRPTTVRALTAGLSDLFQPDGERDGGGFSLPDAMAIEAAPFLLASGPRLTLTEYRRNPVLYRTRVSAALRRNASTGAATGISLGVRLTLDDDADLRMNQVYIDSATALATAINQIHVDAAIAGGPRGEPVYTPAQKDSLAQLTALVDSFVERWEKTRWNADVFDVAGGLLASADSLGNDLGVATVAGWGTWGRGFGDWGQLLVGVRGSFGRASADADRVLGGSIGARLYAGTNAYKVFLETQGTVSDGAVPGWLLHTGGEARVYPRVWVNFSAGVDWQGGGDAGLTGRLSLKGAVPPIF